VRLDLTQNRLYTLTTGTQAVLGELKEPVNLYYYFSRDAAAKRRKAGDDALIVADGTSCRHQIHDGSNRQALHVARVLAMSLGTVGGSVAYSKVDR